MSAARLWLYRIATNACLTALDGRARRALPSGLGPASDDPGAELLPALDIPRLQPCPDSRFETAARDDLRLALVAADVAALVRMVAADAVMEMPPVPLWYRGSRDYGWFLRRVFEMRGTDWRMRRLTANGRPALAAYATAPDGRHHLHTLQVFTVAEGRIARNVVFADPAVLSMLVVSRTLTDVSAWNNSRLLDGDLVEAVKSEHRDVIITGSLSIVHLLMSRDLIDEYRLLTFPAVLGSGAQLFPAGSPIDLECEAVEPAGAAVFTRYARPKR